MAKCSREQQRREENIIWDSADRVEPAMAEQIA